jgi:excisionase family DNA binding protein
MILTVAQAAQRLSLSAAHVRRLAAAGALKATRHGERAWLIAEADLARVKLRPNGRQKKAARKKESLNA